MPRATTINNNTHADTQHKDGMGKEERFNLNKWQTDQEKEIQTAPTIILLTQHLYFPLPVYNVQ